jgi:hypothetical protein
LKEGGTKRGKEGRKEGKKEGRKENGNWRQARVTILITENVDFKPKLARSDKEGHYIFITETIQQETITFVNIYAPKVGAPDFVKQILLYTKRTDRCR